MREHLPMEILNVGIYTVAIKFFIFINSCSMKEIEKLQSIQDRSIRKKKRDCPDILLCYSCLNYELISRVALVEIQICVFFFHSHKKLCSQIFDACSAMFNQIAAGIAYCFLKTSLFFFFFWKTIFNPPFATESNRTLH